MRSLFTVSPLRKDPAMMHNETCVYDIVATTIDHFQRAPIGV